MDKPRTYIDVMNIMFTCNDELYQTVTQKEKNKNAFLINKRFAIAHPDYAYKLSVIKNVELIVDIWYTYIKDIYKGNIPKWVYTKVDKEIKEKSLTSFTERSKLFYISKNKIKETDFNQAVYFSPNVMTEELKNIELHLKTLDKFKK